MQTISAYYNNPIAQEYLEKLKISTGSSKKFPSQEKRQSANRAQLTKQ